MFDLKIVLKNVMNPDLGLVSRSEHFVFRTLGIFALKSLKFAFIVTFA